MATIRSSGFPPRNAPNSIRRPWGVTSTGLAKLLPADLWPLRFGIPCQQRCVRGCDNVSESTLRSVSQDRNLCRTCKLRWYDGSHSDVYCVSPCLRSRISAVLIYVYCAIVQCIGGAARSELVAVSNLKWTGRIENDNEGPLGACPGSYTHLTLPTKRIV